MGCGIVSGKKKFLKKRNTGRKAVRNPLVTFIG